MINDLILCSPDTTLIKNQRRILPDLVKQRELKWGEQIKQAQKGAN